MPLKALGYLNVGEYIPPISVRVRDENDSPIVHTAVIANLAPSLDT